MKIIKPVSILLRILVVFVFFLAEGCSTDNSETDPVYIPVLTTQWFNAQDSKNIFTFNKLGSTNIGTLTGTEGTVGSSATYKFSGSYKNREIEFAYDANPASGFTSKKGKYIGKITGDGGSARIILISQTLGGLILKR